MQPAGGMSNPRLQPDNHHHHTQLWTCLPHWLHPTKPGSNVRINYRKPPKTPRRKRRREAPRNRAKNRSTRRTNANFVWQNHVCTEKVWPVVPKIFCISLSYITKRVVFVFLPSQTPFFLVCNIAKKKKKKKKNRGCPREPLAARTAPMPGVQR